MKLVKQTQPYILRRKDVEKLTGLKKTAIAKRIKEGTFPQSVNLGSKVAVGWLSTEVHEWLNQRIQARDQGDSHAHH
ncbi:MAG: helix-turn-helix transcriptional regulator [Methylophilaceae bacterium]